MNNFKVVHNQTIANPETRTYYVNVDSRFKMIPGSPDSNFAVKLVNPLRSATKIRVASVEFPNVPLHFSEYLGNNSFVFIDSSGQIQKTVTISDGNYTKTGLIEEISGKLSPDYTIELNPETEKVSITATGSPYDSYIIHFDYFRRFDGRSTDWGLGYYLGFRKLNYRFSPSATTITSESTLNVNGFPYYFLQINGYDIVHSTVKDNTVLAAAKLILQGDVFSTIFQDGRNLLSFVYEPHPPVDLANVTVRVIDPFGNDVHPFYEPMSVTLEVTTILQSQLYERQRNRLFDSN